MAPSIRNRTWGIAVLCCIVLGGLVIALAGDLEPPGPPAPTMEHLIRTINLPMTITVSGSYALAEDITTSGGGITVSVSNVTIDLRGHLLQGGTGDGIGVGALGLKNIVVKNGTIRGWGSDGVDLLTSTPVNTQVIDVLSEGNLGSGIRAGTGALVSGCTANGNTQSGIEASGTAGTIVNSTATSNAVNGFNIAAGAWTVTNCSAALNTAVGINDLANGTMIVNCTSRDNNGDGIFAVQGSTVASCSAFSNGDSVGDDGIVGSSGATIVDCTAVQNFEDGIEAGTNALVRGNRATNNGGAGIHATGTGNRIEDNALIANTGDGITVNPATSNFVIRNSATANGGGAFNIVAGNSYGLVTAGSANFNNSNSWANYTY